ncbi:MAG: hypothetical protein N2376_03155 [Clostridia bacterium]|nr:hypothetical protein [Clostridia bacterium]
MKHGVRPTRAQKIAMKNSGLDPREWLIIKAFMDRLEIVHRVTGIRQDVYLKAGE